MSEDQIQPRRLLRPTAFRIGLLSGLAVFLVSCGLFYLWLVRPFPEPRYNVEVVSSGADLSRAGARRLVVSNRYAGVLLAATCQDACDDLWHRLKHQGDEDVTYQVQVLDAAGGCVACGQPAYVEGVFGGGFIARWTLAGDLNAQDMPHYFNLERDGSLTPLDDEPAPSRSPQAAAPKAVSTP